MNDFEGYFKARSRREADILYGTIVSENSNHTYLVERSTDKVIVTAAPSNRQDRFARGTWVVLNYLGGSGLAVGAGYVIISRAPAEQKGLSGTTPAIDHEQTQPVQVITTISPKPISLIAGGPAVSAKIYGAGFLATTPPIFPAGITSNLPPVIGPKRIDISIRAESTVAPGAKEIRVGVAKLPRAIRVRLAEVGEIVPVVGPDVSIEPGALDFHAIRGGYHADRLWFAMNIPTVVGTDGGPAATVMPGYVFFLPSDLTSTWGSGYFGGSYNGPSFQFAGYRSDITAPTGSDLDGYTFFSGLKPDEALPVSEVQGLVVGGGICRLPQIAVTARMPAIEKVSGGLLLSVVDSGADNGIWLFAEFANTGTENGTQTWSHANTINALNRTLNYVLASGPGRVALLTNAGVLVNQIITAGGDNITPYRTWSAGVYTETDTAFVWGGASSHVVKVVSGAVTLAHTFAVQMRGIAQVGATVYFIDAATNILHRITNFATYTTEEVIDLTDYALYGVLDLISDGTNLYVPCFGSAPNTILFVKITP